MAKSSGGTRNSINLNISTQLTSSQVHQLEIGITTFNNVIGKYIQGKKDLYPETIQLWEDAKKLVEEFSKPNSDMSEKSYKTKFLYRRNKAKQLLKSKGDFENEIIKIAGSDFYDGETPNHDVLNRIFSGLHETWVRSNKIRGNKLKSRTLKSIISNDKLN